LLGKVLLSDLIDFSSILQQKFDGVQVLGDNLVLAKAGEKIKLPIKQNPSVVSKTIDRHYNLHLLPLEFKVINLPDLKALPAIDVDKQTEIKNVIDDLVFCLYFNIDVPRDKIYDAKFIKSLCMKNEFYTQL
jgi:hypothetical protein